MIGKLEAESNGHIGKYFFANRNIQLWNQLPADVLGNLSCKPSNLRKGIGK
jgi:hypothetical protein